MLVLSCIGEHGTVVLNGYKLQTFSRYLLYLRNERQRQFNEWCGATSSRWYCICEREKMRMWSLLRFGIFLTILTSTMSPGEGLPTTTQSPEQNFEELMMTTSHGMNWEDQTTLTTVVNWEWIFGENNIEGTGGTIKMLEMKQTTASSENGLEFGESTTWFGGEFGWNENGPEFEESTTWFEGGEFGWNEGIEHGSTTDGFGNVLLDLEPTTENVEIDPGLLAPVTTTELSTKQTTHTSCFRRKWMWRSTAAIFKPTLYLLLVGWTIERIIFN